jgi:ATP-dependent helicase HrpA
VSDRAARGQPSDGATLRAALPLNFKRNPDLPIESQRDTLLAALRDHQVVIVAGETGSGKSTQLPQYCLELGRGIGGLIAHTQPRRLAARALAARIADELGQTLGGTVGFRVRFADQVSAATRLVLMTDGLLLAEITGDPLLRRYDTLIIDEAHERTLNVDLLFGVVKRLLPRRPDLKVIVTSATLDVERIAQFFGGGAIIQVSGRSHPIEVRYRPPEDEQSDPDLPMAVLAAYQEIATEPGVIGHGDVLVFLPGEREIRDVGELLERELGAANEVLSLYSRLSWEQQSRIFQRGSKPRIVLSTNVAETSVTVPGIRAVIDSGLVRISRYSVRNRLQRLPIEPVSRASAEQRKGRCGRIGAGLCLRLYAEADFEARSLFTEPEILRTNLAALLLRLAADGLGDAEEFPFLDAPDTRALNDGYRLLQELQALDERRITRRGRAMARLPLDPRLARSLLEAKRFRAEAELLAIVAGLSVPDVHLAPAGGARGAERDRGEDAADMPFVDQKSEFSGLVKLFRAYRRIREGPRRELRRWCKERQLSLLRLSEWDDVYQQVTDRARELGIVAQRQPASYAGVHRSLLAGFCTMVGVKDAEGGYLGTRGVRFYIFPGSPLAKRQPRWVMAANIVETSRVFARRVAEIEPKWIESAAAHLLKHEYLEPDFDEGREEVVARERISFLGLVLSANRIVNYGPIQPEESRRIFAREALVYQRLARRPAWLTANDAALGAAQQLEERLRTRDLVHPAEVFVDFYDTTLPRQVSSGVSLDHHSRNLTPQELRALTLGDAQIFARQPDPLALAQFPEQAAVSELVLPVAYRFLPGDARDGATLEVPLALLPRLTHAELDAAIPGLSAPRVEALLRSLPKEARRLLIPIPATVDAFLASSPVNLDVASIGAWLKDARGIAQSLLRFDPQALPAHLKVQVRVVDQGAEIARGVDLGTLRRECAAAARAALGRIARQVFAPPLRWREFVLQELPGSVAVMTEAGVAAFYPALAVQDGGLDLVLEWTEAEAERRWQDAGVRLARQLLAPQARDLAKALSGNVVLSLGAAPYLNSEELADFILQMVFRRACFDDASPPRMRGAFEAAVERGRPSLFPTQDGVIAQVTAWCADANAVRGLLGQMRSAALAPAVEESRAHLKRLLRPRLLLAASPEWLRQWPRYLKAELRRWQRNAARGAEGQAAELQKWQLRLHEFEAALHAQGRWLPALDEFAFWIEEFRVSLYAQELKTVGAVSAVRLEARAAEIDAWLRR